MSESLKLIEQFARLRQKSARFYRADFHMHSPFSHDWMNGSGNPILDRDTSLPVREDKVKAQPMFNPFETGAQSVLIAQEDGRNRQKVSG